MSEPIDPSIDPLMIITVRRGLIDWYLATPGAIGAELKEAMKHATPLPPRHLCTLCQSELGEKYHQDVPVVVPGNPPGNRVDLCLECHKTTMEKIDAVRS